ncbi:ATP-binding protein [Streptomyces sp. SR27]|uniref:ATP-binding protein n=1 Tax=Streptomyces sp. SR27 TaxID=3076630 RepID=UPI00295B2831|nr:ATP-binding protein [Streptomyces sp. SR27]MDV9189574.1 ATP-binding protein [Streptomyces sp. SR27]
MKNAVLAPPAPPPVTGASYRLTAPSLSTTPKIARDWVVSILRSGQHAPLAERARVCTSEVVTNAYLHGRTPLITVEVTLGQGRVSVLVRDENPYEMPKLIPVDHHSRDEHGRGLLMVDCFADHWDVRLTEAATKVVSFMLVDPGREAAA